MVCTYNFKLCEDCWTCASLNKIIYIYDIQETYLVLCVCSVLESHHMVATLSPIQAPYKEALLNESCAMPKSTIDSNSCFAALSQLGVKRCGLLASGGPGVT